MIPRAPAWYNVHIPEFGEAARISAVPTACRIRPHASCIRRALREQRRDVIGLFIRPETAKRIAVVFQRWLSDRSIRYGTSR